MWYAALIQDINEKIQTADIAWIGFNIQSKNICKSNITVLNTLDPDIIFVGAVCSSVFPETGIW